MPYFSTVSRSACGQARTRSFLMTWIRVTLLQSEPWMSSSRSDLCAGSRGSRYRMREPSLRASSPAAGWAWTQVAKGAGQAEKEVDSLHACAVRARRRVSRGVPAARSRARWPRPVRAASLCLRRASCRPTNACGWTCRAAGRAVPRCAVHRAGWPTAAPDGQHHGGQRGACQQLGQHEEVGGTTGSRARSRKRSATIWWAERGTSATT